MRAPIFMTALVLAVHVPVHAQDSEDLSSNVEIFSYGVGLQIGQQLKRQGLDGLDVDAISLAIEDILQERDLRISMDEMRTAATAYQNELNAEKLAASEKNKADGEKFLEENGTKDGVVVLDSGLQYRIVESGAGDKPTETDTVVVHYRGRLLDGTEFDSSFGRGEPTELTVGQVIPGWQEALQLMPVGAIWEVWIPAPLAYGSDGAGSIGPNQTLHFDIQLIEIKG